MSECRSQASDQITNTDELRERYADVHPLAVKKCIGRLDQHAIDFISRSPFLCVGTQNANGMADVSPRGDPPGFVKVIDETTLAIPDRPGNNRLDSFANILSNPNVGLLFMVPGFDETLRVNGTATLSINTDLLASMAVKDRAPSIAIVVNVREVFMHCAKAFRRSKLWAAASLQNRNDMPSLAKIILDQVNEAPEDDKAQEKIDRKLEEDYKNTMY